MADEATQQRRRRYAIMKKAKVRHSRFLITVNPLVPKIGSSDFTEETLRQRLNAAGRLFDKPAVKEVIYFAKKQPHSDTYSKNIKSITSEFVIESGTTMKVGLHLHCYLHIVHDSNIRLNFGKIRSTLQKLFNGKKVHFNAKVIRSGPEKDDIATVRAYIRKNTTQKDAMPTQAE